MNGTEIHNRIKRLKYRANHRGIKEMDIILGGFALAQLEQLSAAEIDQFEQLLEQHDRDLILWFTGEAEFPLDDLKHIFRKISAHIVGSKGDA